VISIIIPVYNELRYLPKLIEKVLLVKWPNELGVEIIVVDDGSNDGSVEWLKKNSQQFGLLTFFHEKNRGKGAALKTGFFHACGEVVVVQDSDLEYDPNELINVTMPIISKQTKVCYGSRHLKKGWTQNDFLKKQRGYLFAYLGGRFITYFCNFLYGSNLTDEPTCYKAFERKFLQTISLISEGFELEPELTAKILKRTSILEVPIHYYPRSYEDGKKINWKDGVSALWKLLKYRFVD